MISVETLQRLFTDKEYRKRWLEATRCTNIHVFRCIEYAAAHSRSSEEAYEVALICMGQDKELSSLEDDRIVDSLKEERKMHHGTDTARI